MPAGSDRVATAEAIASWLSDHVASTRGLPRSAVDRKERLSRYGLDSLGAARLVQELSVFVGRPLPATLPWEYPTIQGLTDHLTGVAEPAQRAARQSPRRGDGPRGEDEPIAVVGMAARLPGAPDVASFWRLLSEGRSAVTDVPEGRWDERILRNTAVGPDERKKVRRGAFLDSVDRFDPLFFGVSPREAAAMDPQQRLLLELTWEALEAAGIRPSTLAGTDTAVLVGAIWQDYAHLAARRAGIDGIGPYTVTGAHHSILANRISYVLGLHGPSFAIDSACSSGLVVAHLAAESLRSGESTLAIAGAVNLDVLPESALGVSRFGALSQDGTCYTFDARANGYVRGEGGGVLILKRLSRAIADGDPVLCVLRGSAVNNDGASNGLTAPNPKAQEAVLRSAYLRAGVDPAEVQYVEAHGTGTPLGDPIEARALGAVLGAERAPESPLFVGSAKTNIGHLEGAAGTVGLIKVALCIQHRLLPPSRNFASPNPRADLADLHLAVPTALCAWPAPEKRLMAGVSSFGLGGTNGHVVVEEWPGPSAEVVVLSGNTPAEVRRRATELRAALDGPEALTPLRDIAARALGGEAPLGGARADAAITVVARTQGELRGSLDRWLSGEPGPSVRALDRSVDVSRGPVFVFPGQGAQWHGMALSLLHREPVFRATIERCDAGIRRELGWSLVEELLVPRASSRLHDIEVSLPAIISIDIAVAAWWRSMGVEPAAVVGHSTGEIAAAHVAGALDLDDTMRVICAYGRLITRLSDRGGMALLGLPWDKAGDVLSRFEGRVFRAIADSAEGTVLAGEPAALDALVDTMTRQGIYCRRVAMNVSPHCPLVDELRDELHQRLRGIRPRPTTLPHISEVTGAEVAGESLDAAHWVKNFGDPAFFSRAVDDLIRRGHRVFIDVGPHPITKHSVETNLRHAGVTGRVLSSLRRDEDERTTLLDSLASLAAMGLVVRWSALYPETGTGAGGLETGLSAGGEGDPVLLPISAKTPEALSEQASSFADLLGADSCAPLRDVAYTAAVRRDHHRHRLAVTGTSRAEISETLRRAARGEITEGAVRGEAGLSGRPKVVFVLPGQGSQWLGMGRELYASEPAYREALSECDRVILRESGFSVVTEVFADEATSRLGEIDVIQPLLFAMEVALGALWRSWGVEPDEVIGHSMGEAAAAHLAGLLTLEDAAKVICRRSRILKRLSGRGAMALVELTKADAEKALRGRESRLSVAVSNGPRSTVISGDPVALDELLSDLSGRGVFCRRVKVDVASHSPQMDELTEDLLAALRDVRPQEGRVPMRSTVTGELVIGPELTAAYWVQNLRRPVLFSTAVTRALGEGTTLFVELSPHPILLPSIGENIGEARKEGAAIASTRRKTGERAAMLSSLGQLHVQGVPVDWARQFPDGGRVVSLPAYAWQRQSCWVEAEEAESGRGAGAGLGPRPLLGPLFRSSLHEGERAWEASFDARSSHFFADHRVQGQTVFPGAGYLELALEAAAEEGEGPATLEDVVFDRMLGLTEAPCGVQVALSEAGAGSASVTVSSRAPGDGGGEWRRHATMTLRRPAGAAGDVRAAAAGGRSPDVARARLDLPALQDRCRVTMDVAELYASARKRGIDYGPRFRLVAELSCGEGQALGHVRLTDDLDETGHVLHPALLDACLHVSLALLPEPGVTFVPVRMRRLRVQRPAGRALWAHVTRVSPAAGGQGEGPLVFDIVAVDSEGSVVFDVEGLAMARVAASRGRAEGSSDGVHAIVWRPSETPSLPAEGLRGTWIVVLDRESRFGADLVGRIREAGGHPVEAEWGPAFTATGVDSYKLDAACPGQFERLLAAVRGKHKDLRGVVHCLGLDARPWSRTSAQTLEEDIRSGTFAALLIAQALLRTGARDMPRLFALTRGAQLVEGASDRVSPVGSVLWGFLKTAALEHAALECKRVDLPADPFEGEAESVVRELGATDGEDQVALRRAGRRVARLVRSSLDDAALRREALSPALTRPFRLEIATPGTLENLALVEHRRRAPGPGEVEIEVQAAGLNFLDVLLALGAMPEDDDDSPTARLGWECSGTIVAVGAGVSDLHEGQAVIAVAPHAMASHVVARRELVIAKPEALSWEEAATLPIAFMTAYHGLSQVGRLAPGERVLIHAASGGVGIAAIQWAQHVGAEILATAGSEEKRERVRRLGVTHVFDSRSLSFADDVRRATGGEGVDVVLNSVSGDLLSAGFDLLRDHGRFIELGKRDYHANNRLGMRPFLRNLTFSLVDLRGMILKRPKVVGRILAEVVGHFRAGTFRAPPCEAFPVARAAEAFSLMALAKHAGKIALRMREPGAMLAPRPRQILSDRTYVVTGGLGGLGLAVARFLAEAGAGHLVLVGRRPPGAAANEGILAMKSSGADVTVLLADVSKVDHAKRLFDHIADRLPPLGGVIHAAGILDDRTLLEIGDEQFWAPMQPKVLGAWNMHALTRHLPLDVFIVYSSVAGVLGSRGQAAYAGANAFLDGLAHARGAEGLPATIVQWGLFSEVGLAAAAANRGSRLASQGLEPITPAEGVAFVGEVLLRPVRSVGFFRWNVRQWLEAHPQAAGRPFFAELDTDAPIEAAESDLPILIARADPESRAAMMEQHILEHVGKVVRLDPSRIDRRTPFTNLGVDSLASLELRNRIEASLGLQLSAALLFTYATPLALAGHLLRALLPDGGAPDAARPVETRPEGPSSAGSADPATATQGSAAPESAGHGASTEDADALQMLQDFEEYLR